MSKNNNVYIIETWMLISLSGNKSKSYESKEEAIKSLIELNKDKPDYYMVQTIESRAGIEIHECTGFSCGTYLFLGSREKALKDVLMWDWYHSNGNISDESTVSVKHYFGPVWVGVNRVEYPNIDKAVEAASKTGEYVFGLTNDVLLSPTQLKNMQ